MVEKFDNILKELTEVLNNKDVFVYGTYCNFYPQEQRIKIDFLNKKDWPNSIPNNSIYLVLDVNLSTDIVKASYEGYIYLTESDRKKTYMAMCSLNDIFKSNGKRQPSKQKYNINNICKMVDNIKQTLNKYTSGYPYKQMIIDIR